MQAKANESSKSVNRTLAGAARVVITPPVGYPMGNWGLRQGVARGVYRDIFARSVVFTSGSTMLAIVSLEICGLTTEAAQAIKARVFQLTGIPAGNVLLNFTHNHTSPDTILSLPEEWSTWAAWLTDQVAGCVFSALYQAAPASVGAGSGSFEGWTVNRQYHERPVDTELGVLCVDDDEGQPIARLVNFACHGVADGGQYLEWSGDFAGEMSAHIEGELPGSVAMYVQGAAGDIHPYDWWFGNTASEHLHTHEDTALLGKSLGSTALEIDRITVGSPIVPLAVAEATVELPRHQVNWTVDEALQNRDRLRASLGTYSGETWPDGTTTANTATRHPELYGVGNNEVGLAQNQGLPPLTVPVRGFRIGDTVISAHPGELFNELGSVIKNAFPVDRPWVASYCDGYIGYISTRQPHDEIADIPITEIVDMTKYRPYYGTTTSPYAPEAGEALVATAINLLKTIQG